MVRSRNFYATRHFYFGETTPYTLGLECPWRIRKDTRIVVGSEDYSEPAEGNSDPAWEPGMPEGHLQDQKLAELFGELKAGAVLNAGAEFVVETAEVDGCGGIRVGLGRDYVHEAFPTSSKSMEWIFRSPDRPSLVLMNGVVNRCEPSR